MDPAVALWLAGIALAVIEDARDDDDIVPAALSPR
jgi:hypothetical protein